MVLLGVWIVDGRLQLPVLLDGALKVKGRAQLWALIGVSVFSGSRRLCFSQRLHMDALPAILRPCWRCCSQMT